MPLPFVLPSNRVHFLFIYYLFFNSSPAFIRRPVTLLAIYSHYSAGSNLLIKVCNPIAGYEISCYLYAGMVAFSCEIPSDASVKSADLEALSQKDKAFL